jgi:hypothetical protein
LWEKSLKNAKEMGERYDLAMTHLEMGKCLNDQEHLMQAEAIFAEIGAAFDLAEAQRLLGKAKAEGAGSATAL